MLVISRVKALFPFSYFGGNDVFFWQTYLLLVSRFSHVRLCATPHMAAHPAPPSLGFSRQEHWSGSFSL